MSSDDGLFESPELTHGEQFTQEFDKPGTYSYYCHRNSFMSGTIIVLAAQQTPVVRDVMELDIQIEIAHESNDSYPSTWTNTERPPPHDNL